VVLFAEGRVKISTKTTLTEPRRPAIRSIDKAWPEEVYFPDNQPAASNMVKKHQRNYPNNK
jgi:hypothetical protein